MPWLHFNMLSTERGLELSVVHQTARRKYSVKNRRPAYN